MTTYKQMAKSYQESINGIQGRIEELNVQINSNQAGGGEELNRLVERRYRCYQQVWELQEDLRSIREYIEAVEEREAAGVKKGA